MKKLRWPLLIVLLALGTIAVLLLSQQKDLPAIVPDEVEPVSGGIYSEALIGSFSRLNPVLDLYNRSDHDVDRLLFSGLIRFDDHGLLQLDLAESWGVSQDGKVYNFSLRPDAVWHDGKPVTSDDVIFTIEMMQDENSVIPADVRELWNSVEINRFDDKMIQFRLPDPFAPFLDYLAFGILPRHLFEGVTFTDLVDSSFNLQPVGSGPYQFDHLIVEDGVIHGIALKAFEEYYGQRPFIDQFVVRYYPDGASALAAYRTGEVMGLGEVPPEILPDALKEVSLNLYTGRLPELSMVFFNLDNPKVPFFEDPAIRQALLAGLNRQRMIDRLLDGQAIIADGPVFPGTWAYYDGIERVEYNPDQAEYWIKEAGYNIPSEGGSIRVHEDGTKLAFTLLHPDDPRHTSLAEAIQADWERLGVEVTLEAMPYDELVSDYLETRLYQAALIDLNLARSPDPDPYPFWHEAQTTSGQNYSKWDDRQASEYLEQARVIVDMGERGKHYRNFQVRFNQELPALPLFYPVYTYAVSSEVQGVRMGPLFDSSDRFATVNTWFLLARQVAVTGKTTATTDGP